MCYLGARYCRLSRGYCLIASVLIGSLFIRVAEPAFSAEPTEDHPEWPLLRVSVVTEDGRPAAGARLQNYDNTSNTWRTFIADAEGRAEVRDPFYGGITLHAATVDGIQQGRYFAPADAVRTRAAHPIQIQLAPSVAQSVRVLANGKPIQHATVAAKGLYFLSMATTNADGEAQLLCPRDSRPEHIAAWHPALGVQGWQSDDFEIGSAPIELSLAPPGRHVTKIVDETGKPVVGVTIGVNVRLRDGPWIVVRNVEAAHAVTDDNGEIHWNWMPATGLKYLDVDLISEHWKCDDIDFSQIAQGRTTVHVRKRKLVLGLVVPPPGVDPTGLLITGRAFGPGRRGDLPRARVRPNGAFTMFAPTGHGHVVGIADTEWSSDLWTGNLIPRREPLVLEAYPATPIEVRVTRGAAREPLADAWVDLNREKNFDWTREDGSEGSGTSGISYWLRTDADGRAYAGVGRGTVSLRVSAGDWDEEKTFGIKSTDPQTVEFHRE